MRVIALKNGHRVVRRVAALFTAALVMLSYTPRVYAEEGTVGALSSSVLNTDNSYNKYCKENPVFLNGEELLLDITAATVTGGELKQDGDRPVLHTNENATVTWEVSVPVTGSYAIKLDYKPLPGTEGIIKRQIVIDGKVPYDEANSVFFTRVFHDIGEIERDVNSGNDIRPKQEEVTMWSTTYVADSSGYYGDRLYFYLTAGIHSITFNSLQEPMIIGAVSLCSTKRELPTYEEKLAQWRANGATEISGALQNGLMLIEAESMHQKSAQTLYAINDMSSCSTSPSHYVEQRLNCIGGTRWQEAGEWVSWTVDVPQSGLYTIGMRFLQNTSRDMPVGRMLMIEGEIPFEEAKAIPFSYSNKFQTMYVGGKDPYLFYLEKGTREIRLQVSTDLVNELLIEISEALTQLNQVNWSLLTVLGAEPDLYKNYYIDEQLPEVIEVLTVQAENFENLAKRWFELTGEIDTNVSQLEQTAYRLSNMVKDPDKIPSLYSAFRDDLGALGDMIAAARKQPLMLDYLFIAEAATPLPKANRGFFADLWYEIMRLVASYFNDYNGIAVSGADAEQAITVWIGSGVTGGRDQALALNQLIVQDFSARQGVAVNLQLVPGGTILTATLAGVGPDVALSISGSEPVNYAIRGATVDLSQFEDFDEVMTRFMPAAYKAYEYLGGTYAIPETLNFPMMFVRTDIMKSLGIDTASLETWQDVVDILPLVQRRNMNFALPASYNSYAMFLFQNNGNLYVEDGKKSALDTREALDAFHNFIRFYSDYSTPYAYSFEARFRTGEIPLGIADYTVYNTLQISAPEIQGKWVMMPLPGTLQADGTINRTGIATGGGSIIMSASEHKEASWEFIKWWTDTEAQYQFGKELESVMGPAARYNTANLKALERLPWQSADRLSLMTQMNRLQGLPEVPGGYMTSRNVDFAIRKVYNENTETRSTLLSYIESINQELRLKREEFGLE